jgi:DNA-binding transcriptional ArsR family regulator
MDDTGDEVATGHEYLELKRMLKAMGDVHRLDILHVLAGRTETNVTDLAEILVAMVATSVSHWYRGISICCGAPVLCVLVELGGRSIVRSTAQATSVACVCSATLSAGLHQ